MDSIFLTSHPRLSKLQSRRRLTDDDDVRIDLPITKLVCLTDPTRTKKNTSIHNVKIVSRDHREWKLIEICKNNQKYTMITVVKSGMTEVAQEWSLTGLLHRKGAIT